MTPRIPLPEPLRDGPFSVVSATNVGIGEGRLRGVDLARPFHGVRAHGDPKSVQDRALAYAQRIPADAFYCGSRRDATASREARSRTIA